jgi:hypothetical protein
MYCTITAHNNQFTPLHNICPPRCGPQTTIKEENLHKDIKNDVWTIHNAIPLYVFIDRTFMTGRVIHVIHQQNSLPNMHLNTQTIRPNPLKHTG